MLRLLKVLVVLAALALAGLAAYAYLGDMEVETGERRVPVDLGAAGRAPEVGDGTGDGADDGG